MTSLAPEFRCPSGCVSPSQSEEISALHLPIPDFHAGGNFYASSRSDSWVGVHLGGQDPEESHSTCPRVAAPLPGTWGLAAWSFTGRRAEISSPCFPKTLVHVSGAVPCHLLSYHREIFTKDGQPLLDIFLTTTTGPKEKDVKSTMLKIAKASPPQAGSGGEPEEWWPCAI